MHPNRTRHLELVDDALTCIGQFDSVNIRQLAFWLYGEISLSSLSCTHRLIRTLLGKRLVLRRRGGDGIQRFVLACQGASRLGIRAGYHAPLLNAHLYDPVVEFLTIMRLQGFNVFGRGRIRSEAPQYFAADGLVLDTLDDGFGLIYIRNNTSATQGRLQRLKKLIEVRGLGHENLLKQLNVRQARTSD